MMRLLSGNGWVNGIVSVAIWKTERAFKWKLAGEFPKSLVYALRLTDTDGYSFASLLCLREHTSYISRLF